MAAPRVHEKVLGFDLAAERYETSRPEYPAEAIAALVNGLRLRPSQVVVDLAAGTGKLTRALGPFGFSIVAVEPIAGMRTVFRRSHPEIRLLDGTAEAIPVPDASVDAVVVGQAFHWFDGRRALPEIRRVLRPAGGLGLLWNVRDMSVPWVAEVSRLLDRYDSGVPRTLSGVWKASFTDDGPFLPLSERTFHFQQRLDRSAIVDRFLSVSFIAALDPGPQAEFVTELRRILADDPMTRDAPIVELPYRSEVYWTCPR
ncbi:MAG: class I SAM-dependent methyltransferase [Thermoplasmata archaeon]|nr:class I SAM-dependent methyltransferase [Thermoplasmata archaeon]